MEFFLHSSETPDEAEKYYQEIVKMVEDGKGVSISDKGYFKITFWDLVEKEKRIIKVGKPLFENDETVEAILCNDSRKLFYVITSSEGYWRTSFAIDQRSNDIREIESFN